MDQKDIAAQEGEDRQERLANQDSTREFLRSQRIPYPRHVSFAQIVDRAIAEMNWSRDEVYRKLLDAFDRGFFGPYLHFSDMKHVGVEGSEYELQNLTKKKLIDVLCSYEPETVRDHYLAHCWVDVDTANRWLYAEGVKSPFVAEPDSQSSDTVRDATAVNAVSNDAPLTQAGKTVIRRAIHEAYARAKKNGHNAPNLNQIAAPTKLVLAGWGQCAQSDNQIKELAVGGI